uniref:Coiled-coil domain-containing protein 40 n=1 Tax=Pyramimonas obovata TaxID=1411642 RepID=A0A7S0QXY1_9CHLO|mmetsp:Transcript_17470/g.38042  ORF Transcript_17470/g.38042 Transcript_17470/m.38042 type:complete len:885 (+) Transcript_17470:211-2865(+)
MSDTPPPDGTEDGYDYEDEEEEEEEEIALEPNHPLLARAQTALKQQLTEQRLRVEEALRERTEDLRVAKKRREDIGVELYGVQQQLARLQMTLEKTHDNYNVIRRIREQADQDLEQLRAITEEKKDTTQQERRKVEKFHVELDKLNGTLKQIEAYNEQMKNEIAVTRRATYVAEESVTNMEKEKKEQDFLIDNLQEQLKRLHQQHQLYEAQLVAQQRETRAAQETLNEAEQEMEAINFEKKQLAQQWKSSLIGMARRDEALQATEEALRKQHEQELSIDTEFEGYKRSIKGEQQENEKLTGVLKKVEADAEFITKTVNQLREKKEKLQDTYVKLKRSLEQTDENLERAKEEMRLRRDEQARVDKEVDKCNQEITALEQEMLNNVSDQTTVEKSAHKTLQEVNAARKKVQEHYEQSVALQNELAKIKVDILNTQAHNTKLKETTSLLDEELKEKGKTIEKYEVEIRRRNDEIEKKTKDVDRYNRQYEKLTANMEDANTGPLEATIANLQREITNKGVEGKELQRRWVGFQVELVALVNENNHMEETVQRLKSEHTVMLQRRTRLDHQFESVNKEIKDLDHSMHVMHNDMSRLNTLINKNKQLQELLANDNFVLEMDIVTRLKELEGEAAKVEQKIDLCADEKKQVLAELIEAERQIMLWERKIQLEKEMQDALDPTIGGDIVEAMKKEIHRMELRQSELQRQQEKLIQEMEKAILRRDMISMKGRVSKAKKAPDLTEAGLKKAVAELKRSVRDTDAETARSESRIQELSAQREEMGAQLDELSTECGDLQAMEETLRNELNQVAGEKTRTLVMTTQAQRMGRRVEDYRTGKYKLQHAGEHETIVNELGKAESKRDVIRAALENLVITEPSLEQALQKTFLLLSSA